MILVFSFVGMEPLEIAYKGQSEINVALAPSVTEMAEVVVTGIFTRKADSYTGAVTTIKKEELQRVGNQNVLQSLKNLDPSFQVVENNEFGSDPNRVPDIQMRGASSFSDMKISIKQIRTNRFYRGWIRTDDRESDGYGYEPGGVNYFVERCNGESIVRFKRC